MSVGKNKKTIAIKSDENGITVSSTNHLKCVCIYKSFLASERGSDENANFMAFLSRTNEWTVYEIVYIAKRDGHKKIEADRGQLEIYI